MISKEERAELRELTKAADGEWRVLSPGELVFANDATNWAGSTERQEYTTLAIAAVNALPKVLDALDAADERIAGLESEAKHWRESALAWAHWAASVTGESDQEIPDLTKFVATLKSRITELAAWEEFAKKVNFDLYYCATCEQLHDGCFPPSSNCRRDEGGAK